MNGKETIGRFADLILGVKVEGTVAAILPSAIEYSSRYVVITPQQEALDVHVSTIESHGIYTLGGVSGTARPLLKLGDPINNRVNRVEPWMDGRLIHFGT